MECYRAGYFLAALWWLSLLLFGNGKAEESAPMFQEGLCLLAVPVVAVAAAVVASAVPPI